jgi:S1-C subfamily serine protease
MKTTAALLLLLLPAFAWAQGTEENHRKVYDATVDSVVAIRAMAPLGERSGSGVFLTKEGLILTSYSVVPEGSTKIRIWTKGPRQYTGEIVATSKRDEVTLVKVLPKDAKTALPAFKPIVFGDSSKVQQGDVSYTLGNASNSLINDDSPSFNVGVISATYRLNKERANSTYVGAVFETTAAVNVGIEGGPLLNGKGEMVGMVTLNYSPSRFLGAAIPWQMLKDPVALLKDNAGKPVGDGPDVPQGEGVFGATVADKGGKVTITAVEKGGAAEAAGLTEGTTILAVGDVALKTAAEFATKLKGLEAGTRIYLKVVIDGLEDKVTVELQGKKK